MSGYSRDSLPQRLLYSAGDLSPYREHELVRILTIAIDHGGRYASS